MPDYAGSAASSEARYLYYHDKRIHFVPYQTTRADYYWGREAIRAGHTVRRKKEMEAIRSEILVVMAGQDTWVSKTAQEDFIAGLKTGKAFLVPESRHELYNAPNAILRNYLGLVLSWFDRKSNQI